jgi:predicted lactoylglutathione lyase
VPMIFVNLPVKDLQVSRAFYTALGFSINEFSSDEGTLSVVVDDTIVVALHTRERFADLVEGQVNDPAQATSVVVRLTLDSRSDVDDLANKAERAGGRSRQSTHEDADAYTRGFADPDGNAWLLTFLSPRHVID